MVTMDADNTHSPNLIPVMVNAIQKGSDVVIASRYRHGSKVVGRVRDCTCGFRAYRASLLKDAFARFGNTLAQERGFAGESKVRVGVGCDLHSLPNT